MGRWIRGILELSVKGVSGFKERCILRERTAHAFRCAFMEMFLEWVLTIPYGSVICSEYWGGKVGTDIVREELNAVLHMREVTSFED
jgi:hypothetical protein